MYLFTVHLQSEVMGSHLSQCSSWVPSLASPLHLELLASFFQYADGQTLSAHPQVEVVVAVEVKHCQNDADDAQPELVNDDEAGCGSGVCDGNQCGQLCHHQYYLSQLTMEMEELKQVTQLSHIYLTKVQTTNCPAQEFSWK